MFDLKGIAMRHRSFAAAGGFLIASVLSLPAFATNGYFSVGFDEQSKGQAGVGVSSADGVEAAASNPALGLKAGNSVGGGFSLFSPHRDDTNSGGAGTPADLANGKFTSGEELFLVPYLGFNHRIDDETAASLLVYANGGMNTHYRTSPFAGFGGVANPATPAGVDLAQVFITPNLARSIGYGVNIGGGPVLAIQRFQAQGLQAFDNAMSSNAPGRVTNNGYDYSYGGGVKFGATWDPASWVTFGAVFQSRTWTTNFGKYKGLFAEGGNFDIPAQVTSGITIRPIQTLDLSVEHQHIFYGDVKSIANDGSSSGKLGLSDGKGFGWHDMNVYRIGAQWKATNELKLRTGYSHATDFTNGTNLMFNILAPATIKDHASVGASYDITPNLTIGLAYLHAFSKTFTGQQQIDTTQTVKLRMDQDEGTLGIAYRW